MKVVTNVPTTYITSGHSATHKQGKIPAGVVLNTMSETSKAYELEPDHAKAVIEVYDPLRDSDYSKYPAFWVQKADVIPYVSSVEPPVDPVYPPVGGIPSADQVGEVVGTAVAALLKYVFMR